MNWNRDKESVLLGMAQAREPTTNNAAEMENAMYEIGYGHGIKGLPESNGPMPPEYKMGYADGAGDREEGHRFENNQTLAQWYKETPEWQRRSPILRKIGVKKSYI